MNTPPNGNLNFVNSDIIHEEWRHVTELDDKLLKCLFSFTEIDRDFDLQTVPISELKVLNSAFLLATIIQSDTAEEIQDTKRNLKYLIKNEITSQISEIFSCILHMKCLSEYLCEAYCHPNEPNYGNFRWFSNIIEELFRMSDEINKSVECVIQHLKAIIESKSIEYKFLIQIHIFITHEIDFILAQAMVMYNLIQNNFEVLNFIFDQYDFEIRINQRFQLILDYCKKFNDYQLNSKITLEPKPKWMCMKKMIFRVFNTIQNLFDNLIGNKKYIMETLDQKRAEKCITLKFYEQCFRYFSRFNEAIYLKELMVFNIKVRFTRWRGSNSFYACHTIENELIPKIIQECHRLLMTSKNFIEEARVDLKNDEKMSEKIIKLYEKSRH